MKIRIQKHLSAQNILSRRKTEEYLQKGWIKVNGEVVTQLGYLIDPETDVITLGEPILEKKAAYTYLAFNKPRGIVSNCPDPSETEIRDLLPPRYRHLSTIGRLDKESEGLILLTDDGIFAKHLLTHPHEREYLVGVNAEFTQEMAATLEAGVVIESYQTLPVQIKILEPNCFMIRMKEGKNRQIRRMVRTVGLTVTRLKRFRFGTVRLDRLEKGTFRPLTSVEKAALQK